MDRVEAWMKAAESATRPSVDDRVDLLLERIRAGAQKLPEENWDQANERHAEEFIASLREQYSGRVLEFTRPRIDAAQESAVTQWLARGTSSTAAPVVIVERQKLRPMARRTTSFNYVFTVPGKVPEQLILVAHYDTWRGPGADDNTTGEEITKQYLLDDLNSPAPPALTHTYVLAGSEECGLIGFTSQVLLALGLGMANIAMTKGIWAVTALGIAVVPLATFRFGVSGSREYVQSLTREEIARIKSVISVDSVGEGKLYIPDSSLGADFVRAFIPLEGYAKLNDLLKEAAHLHGISYNTFIAGGTTDHISFLEVNSTLRDRLGDWLGCPRWLGCHKYGKRKIPASALVALLPGKASPLVFGGKIHTPNDTADRVYPKPLGDSLRIIDYWQHLMHGGERIREPRAIEEYHYAQLFRVQRSGAGFVTETEYWLAMKDAIEPNRRNLNGLYRVTAEIIGNRAVCRGPQHLNWGVHTRLRHEVEDQLEKHDSWERVHVKEIEVSTPERTYRFAARGTLLGGVEAAARWALGNFERFLGTNAFLAFFGAAWLLAQTTDIVLNTVFVRVPQLAVLFFEWFWLTLPLTVALQLTIVMWLIGVKIPTMIDNSYKHLNKSDNLRSLRRASAASDTSASNRY